jgi:hypothetical protein
MVRTPAPGMLKVMDSTVEAVAFEALMASRREQ